MCPTGIYFLWGLLKFYMEIKYIIIDKFPKMKQVFEIHN